MWRLSLRRRRPDHFRNFLSDFCDKKVGHGTWLATYWLNPFNQSSRNGLLHIWKRIQALVHTSNSKRTFVIRNEIIFPMLDYYLWKPRLFGSMRIRSVSSGIENRLTSFQDVNENLLFSKHSNRFTCFAFTLFRPSFYSCPRSSNDPLYHDGWPQKVRIHPNLTPPQLNTT